MKSNVEVVIIGSNALTAILTGLNTHHYNFNDLHKAMDAAIELKSEALKVMLNFD